MRYGHGYSPSTAGGKSGSGVFRCILKTTDTIASKHAMSESRDSKLYEQRGREGVGLSERHGGGGGSTPLYPFEHAP